MAGYSSRPVVETTGNSYALNEVAAEFTISEADATGFTIAIDNYVPGATPIKFQHTFNATDWVDIPFTEVTPGIFYVAPTTGLLAPRCRVAGNTDGFTSDKIWLCRRT